MKDTREQVERIANEVAFFDRFWGAPVSTWIMRFVVRPLLLVVFWLSPRTAARFCAHCAAVEAECGLEVGSFECFVRTGRYPEED